MELRLFLSALSEIATSPYGLIGYVLVVAAWALSSWQSRRLQIIGERLKYLPEKDRIKALELEYRLVPKGGLDSQSFLQLRATQFKFAAVVVVLLVALLIAALATYKAVEDKKLSSSLSAVSTALEITRLGRTRFNDQSFSVAAGNLEAALKSYPTAVGYLNLGYIYEELSKTDSAIIAYMRAIELLPSNLIAHNNLGLLYKDQAKFDKALKHLGLVIGRTRPGDDIWFQAMINSGTVEYEIGRKTNDTVSRKTQCRIAIEKYYLPALEFKGAITDRDSAAKALSNLANCYKDIEELGKARAALEDSLSIKRKLAASRSLAETLVNLADLKLKQADFAGAKPDILEAITIFRVLENQIGLGTGYFNLGDIAWAQGRLGEAQAHYERSLEFFRLASAGGEYEQAPARRLDRIKRNDEPEFVRKAKILRDSSIKNAGGAEADAMKHNPSYMDSLKNQD